MSSYSDNPMADIYGANLYNRHLQSSRRSRAKMLAQSSKGGCEAQSETAVCDTPDFTPTELGGAPDICGRGGDHLPESCSSMLVCTGVYSRDQQEPVTEHRIFHGHRDFRFDPTLTQPSFVVQDVKEAVELVFQQEGCPLD